MYRHQMEKMAELIADKLSKKPLKTKKAISRHVLLTLQEFWKDKIAITWAVDDVKSVHAGLTDEQALEVLRDLEHYHDADRGISWETIREAAHHKFGKAEKEDEEGDNELIAEYADKTTKQLQKQLADKELALTETDDHLQEVELKDEIDGLKRILDIRHSDENELPEKESDEETSLEFLGPQDN